MPQRLNCIYARLSREDDRHPGTVEEKLAAQVASCQRLADQHGLTVRPEDIIVETASGGSLAKRPGIRSLIQRAQAGEIETILCTFADRLSRLEGRDQYEFEEALSDGNVTVITSTGVTKYGHEEERLPRDVLAAAAAYERRAFGRRLKERNKQKLEANQRTGGATGYGYRRDKSAPGGYTTRPEEYPVLLRILRGILAGRSEFGLCREFERAGIPPPGHRHTGKSSPIGRWAGTTVMRIALNPFYAGRHSQRMKQIKRGGVKRVIHLPPDEYIIAPESGDWEYPLTWEEYCQIRSRYTGRYRPNPPCGMLTGLLYCQEGGRMGRMGETRYQCYCHRAGKPFRTIKRDVIEGAAINALRFVFERLPANALGSTGPREDRSQLYALHAKAQRATRDAFTSLDELARRASWFIDMMGSAAYEESMRRASLAHSAAKAEECRLASILDEPDPEEILPVVEGIRSVGFNAFWEAMTPDERRDLLCACIDRITLAPKPDGRSFRNRPPIVTLAGWVERAGVRLETP